VSLQLAACIAELRPSRCTRLAVRLAPPFSVPRGSEGVRISCTASVFALLLHLTGFCWRGEVGQRRNLFTAPRHLCSAPSPWHNVDLAQHWYAALEDAWVQHRRRARTGQSTYGCDEPARLVGKKSVKRVERAWLG
jgi:hypothetical protein